MHTNPITHPHPPVDAAEAVADFAGTRILVVDDEPLATRSLERVLRARGARVTSRSSAPDALEAVQDATTPFDAAVVDYCLLDRFGLEVISALRSGYYPCCALMITGVRNVDYGRKAIEAGADDFLTKPFDVHEFLHAVERVIQRTHSWRWRLAGARSDEPSATAPPFRPARAPSSPGRSGPLLSLEACCAALAERGGLSMRERQILEGVLTGRKNVDIAHDLGITPRTVKYHSGNALRKLGVMSRSDLTRILFEI